MKRISRKGAKAQRRHLRKNFAFSFAPLRLCASCFFLILLSFSIALGQDRPESHSNRVRPAMSPEVKALVEDAIGIVCTQAKLDPKSSIAIDEMQARPSLPIHSPEARTGAERAQRLL